MSNDPISIYDYTDYRLYLRDYFTLQKESDCRFSYQFFANRAGFKSKSFAHLVINGKKDLTSGTTFQFSKAIGHDKREAQYFELLINFNQSKKLEEKNYYYEQLNGIVIPRKKTYLQKDRFEFFQHWYIVPIRELVTFIEFKEDFHFLGRQLDPPISARQAKDAVELLIRLGLIKKHNDGSYSQIDRNLHSGEEIQSLAVSNFQRKTIELANRSLQQHSTLERDISTLTFGLNEEGLQILKKKLMEVRAELADTVAAPNLEIDRVYQLNLQLYPLTIFSDSKK